LYSQNQVQNPPTAEYWLSMIGGILGMLGSIVFFAFGTLTYYAYSNVAGYYGYYGNVPFFGWGWSLLFGLGALMLISSILIILFASKLKANPLEHTKWGIFILVFSIIGLGGGILALIGGILALVYNPIPAGTSQQYGQPTQTYTPPPQRNATMVCPQCGRIVDSSQRFCPNCGKQLN
jgi:zinc-ribbon domain/Protein of unknown function (DUF4064)